MGKMQQATFAGGCFWCIEAVFQRLKGVITVQSGYTGGTVRNPSYEEVSEGVTGHAEAVQITFDPTVISYEQLLDVFWRVHDPTTKDRQGADIGTQYRSVIFYHNDEQKKLAEDSKKRLDESKRYHFPVVTEILPIAEFYPAEEYHTDYYNANRNQGYCRLVIDPKIQKLSKDFKPLLKNEEQVG